MPKIPSHQGTSILVEWETLGGFTARVLVPISQLPEFLTEQAARGITHHNIEKVTP